MNVCLCIKWDDTKMLGFTMRVKKACILMYSGFERGMGNAALE